MRRNQQAKDKKKKFKRFRKRRCRFTRLGVEFIDWKDVPTLQRLCTGQGKLLGRKRSGNTAGFQRMLDRAVKRARYMGLMTYIGS
ncbi:MAG: 30S ribosomal protein S18 [Planctomycetota bacterium]|jgi:small subunit ribosomal protein S18